MQQYAGIYLLQNFGKLTLHVRHFEVTW